MASSLYSRCWGKMFLSWKKKHHRYFVRELKARLSDIGIDLIIKGTYDQFLAEKLSNLHSPLTYLTSVFITQDYVSSSLCITELIQMHNTTAKRDEPSCISFYYFNDNEKDDNRSRCFRYIKLAGAALNIPKARRMDVYGSGDEMTPYLAIKYSFSSLGLFRDLPNKYYPDIAQISQSVKRMHPFFKFPCLQSIYDVLSNDDEKVEQQIMYVGILGTDSKACKPMTSIVKSLSHKYTRQLPTTLVKYVKVVDTLNHSSKMNVIPSPLVSGDSLQNWGAQLINLLIFGENTDATTNDVYQQLQENDYLLVIDNLGYYDQLEELAKMLDLASSSTKVVFTTTNPDFIPRRRVQWENTILEEHNKPELSLVSFKGKISEIASHQCPGLNECNRELESGDP